MDNYGCPYDTTVSFTVVAGPEIFSDTVACNLEFQVSETVSFSGGVWSSLDTTIGFSNENIIIVFENLQKGSRNHLRAFNRQLVSLGVTYIPIYIMPLK